MLPRWTTWLFLAALVYLIYSNQWQTPSLEPAKPPPSTESPTATSSSEALRQTFDPARWQWALDPTKTDPCTQPKLTTPYSAWVETRIDNKGEGVPAACGDTVQVELRLWLPTLEKEGTETVKKGTKTLGLETLILGDPNVPQGINVGLVGIELGEMRTLILRPEGLKTRSGKMPEYAKNFPRQGFTLITALRQK